MTNPRPDLDMGLANPVVHFATFYVLCVVAFVSFPKIRRTDVVLGVAVFAGGVELLRLSFGQPAPLALWSVDLAAAAAVYLPSEIEHLRRLARTSGYLRFTDIAANDRRRGHGRRRVEIAAQDRFSVLQPDV